MNAPTQCGFVAIVGRPNSGKSTLLNSLVKQYLSPSTSKPQTTRFCITGILTEANQQAIFIDTPGADIHQKLRLNRTLNKSIIYQVTQADLVILLTAGIKWDKTEDYLCNQLTTERTNCILGINKIDLIKDKSTLLPFMSLVSEKYPFVEIIPISAKTKDNLPDLQQSLFQYMPYSPLIYSNNQVSSTSDRLIVSELIREKVLENSHQEVPYAAYIDIEKYAEHDDKIVISAVIWVQTDGQKAILIGKNGRKIKTIGIQARHSIEKFLIKPVELKLWVKLKPDWIKSSEIVNKILTSTL